MGSNNHPNQRSVNAAFFAAFLRHLLHTPSPATTNLHTQRGLVEALREVALDEAFDRLTRRRALSIQIQPTPFQDRRFSFGVDHGIYVHDNRGNALALSAADQAVVRGELGRLTRGMPPWLPPLWDFPT